MKAKQTANIYTKRYVDEVFLNRLLEEGFVCPDDKHLCWYRFNEEGIINSIVFYSCWSNIPVFLEVGYGIHPLFRKPAHTTSIQYSNRPIASEILYHQPLVENVPISSMRYVRYSDDILVQAPGVEGRGIYTFDGILLPRMDSIRTIADCYDFHKQQYLKNIGNDPGSRFRNLSDLFVDEAIYVDDVDMYPYCRNRIEYMVELYQDYCKENPTKKAYQIMRQEWEQRREAFLEGGRTAYVEVLEKRLHDNLLAFKKKVGIAD